MLYNLNRQPAKWFSTTEDANNKTYVLRLTRKTVYQYSQTSVKQEPKGKPKCGCLWQEFAWYM